MTPLVAPELTLVAHYGDKPPELASLLEAVLELVARRCGAGFEPYALGQIHATLVGLETALVDGRRVNRWFWEGRGETRLADPAAVVQLLRQSALLPFQVRLGGYLADEVSPFTSRGQPPHVRSFQIQADKVVVMGWPESSDGTTETLVRLRRELERANALHKYHATQSARDNDLFFVLGQLHPGALEAGAQAALEDEARDLLAARPVRFDVDRTCLSLCAYSDPSLPLAGTRTWAIDAEEIEARLLEPPGRC